MAKRVSPINIKNIIGETLYEYLYGVWRKFPKIHQSN